VSGRFEIQSLLFDDRISSQLDYRQLAFATNLKMERFLGTLLQLRFRWRSRAFDRERILSSAVSENEWVHNVYELGLIYESKNSPSLSLAWDVSYRRASAGWAISTAGCSRCQCRLPYVLR